MRHRSCSTLHSLHCMYDLSQGTLTITIKDRDIRQRSTSPYFSSPSCPKCPNCSPYESTLPLCTALFTKTLSNSLSPLFPSRVCKCAIQTWRQGAASDTWVSLRFVFVVVPPHPTIPLHSPFISRPWRHFPPLFNFKFLPAAFPLTLPCGAWKGLCYPFRTGLGLSSCERLFY